MCPSSGSDWAVSTRGCELLGPGPISTRVGTCWHTDTMHSMDVTAPAPAKAEALQTAQAGEHARQHAASSVPL